MSDLTVEGTSTWISGVADTATVLSNGPTGDVGVAEQINGLTRFAQDVQTILGAAATLKGSAADLGARLGVLLADNGALRHGISFPVSPPPVDGQLFFRTDSKVTYVYDASTAQWIFGFQNLLYALLDGTVNFTGSLTIKASAPGIRFIGQEANALDWTIRETGGRLLTLLNTGTEQAPLYTEDNFFVPTGGCIEYDGTLLPNGWLWADGAAVSRTTYARLFAAIGTSFGSGDGSTTFNVRDKRGRVSIGVDAATGRITAASFNGANAAVLGGVGGLETHTLTTAQLASHTHPQNAVVSGTGALRNWDRMTNAGGATAWDSNTSNTNASSIAAVSTDAAGSGNAHSNTQPWLACYFIVKT